MKRKFKVSLILILMLLVFMSLAVNASEKGCLDCHSDQEYLKSKEDSKVYVSQKKFNKDTHAMFGCVTCHQGNLSASSKEEAHQNLISKPGTSNKAEETCGQCHTDISHRFEKSLHGTARGQKNGAVHLLGEEVGTQTWNDYCARCHADCSDCHLKEKDDQGNMVTAVDSHNFKQPTTSNCVDCHSQTGFSYVGWGEEYPESVHSKAGLECVDCHGEEQMHGDGEVHQSMTEVVDNNCADCHDNKKKEYNGLPVNQFNEYSYPHATHKDDLDCSACHTDWYMNCQEGCHLEEPPKYTVGELTSDDFYLGRYEGKVYTMTKTPLPTYPEVPNKDVPGHAWVVKVRHSWSDKAKSCETCHTNKKIYPQKLPTIKGKLIKKETVDRIYIDKERFKNSVHGMLGLECADCHQVDRTAKCIDCHSIENIKPIIETADKANEAKGDLKEKLDKIRKEFHYNPGEANSSLKELN
ncbi:cytochrome c3 family protein [Selenihalanaerobacter shriftii]|uniref:Cytochrome c554 and c-prime n=1 Tax=Selenihalanaerobacter shriftii TaxID=142842 RepID=A0A1T4NMF0_9FIRM|nr:cytochrome c3 family protein [Selenihalanaerobacter shriftii]SJZ80384.1 Cytochrome c554 and c-prime [Selenihalanaerobacter shriftii]